MKYFAFFNILDRYIPVSACLISWSVISFFWYHSRPWHKQSFSKYFFSLLVKFAFTSKLMTDLLNPKFLYVCTPTYITIFSSSVSLNVVSVYSRTYSFLMTYKDGDLTTKKLASKTTLSVGQLVPAQYSWWNHSLSPSKLSVISKNIWQ